MNSVYEFDFLRLWTCYTIYSNMDKAYLWDIIVADCVFVLSVNLLYNFF